MSSYHGWTHRPKAQGGTDPIPSAVVPWQIYRWYKETDQTIADDTLTTVNWPDTPHIADAWFSSDGFVRGGNAATAHDTGLTTTDYLYQYATGLWWVSYELEWETGNYTKQSYLQIRDQGGNDFGLEPLFGRDFDGGDVPAGNAGNIYANQLLAQNALDTAAPTYHHHSDLWDISAADTWRWRVRVHHTAGGDRDITQGKLSAIWMGGPLGF